MNFYPSFVIIVLNMIDCSLLLDNRFHAGMESMNEPADLIMNRLYLA